MYDFKGPEQTQRRRVRFTLIFSRHFSIQKISIKKLSVKLRQINSTMAKNESEDEDEDVESFFDEFAFF